MGLLPIAVAPVSEGAAWTWVQTCATDFFPQLSAETLGDKHLS